MHEITSLDDDVRIEITPGYRFSFRGTWQQLIDEGLIPADTRQPIGRRRRELNRTLRGEEEVELQVWRVHRYPRCALGDWWCCVVEPAQAASLGWAERERRELAERERVWNRNRAHCDFDRVRQARDDRPLQDLLTRLAGRRATGW